MNLDQVLTQQKLDELLFIEGEKIRQEDLASQVILLIHAINLTNNLQCTGLLEDDEESNFETVPPNWNNPISGVYSLRYKLSTDIVGYFKFINENNFLSINCVISQQKDQINTLTIYMKELECKQVSNNKNKQFIADYLVKIIKPFKDLETHRQQQQQSKKNEEFKANVNQNQQNNDLGLFWNKPRNDPYKPIQPTNAFGDYGRTDLEPIPLNQRGTFSPFQPLNINPIGGNTGSGNLFGPTNPIFGSGLQGMRPGIRQDPYGPDGINGSFPDIDNEIRQNQPPGFNPNNFFDNNKRGGGLGGNNFPF